MSKYDLIDYKVTKYIKDNPRYMENAEDLFNDVINEFKISDDPTLDQIWSYIRSETNLPK